MLKIDALTDALDKRAPLSLSLKQIEQGAYDNSGLLIRDHESVNKILFALDLSLAAVRFAKRNGCDTVVTHHPAIYAPLKTLDNTGDSAPVLAAVKAGLNVVSMHLNLDVADGGIDASLCAGLGGEKYKILFMTDEKHGYGREFDVKNTELSVFVKNAKTVFGTKRAVVYGSGRTKISKAASFCGGGAEYCAKYVKNSGAADLIISSDLPHHVIKLIVESGKCVLILPHYTAENYGFRQFYEKAAADLKGFAETMFFTDKRFK